jgi:hypothetical protein
MQQFHESPALEPYHLYRAHVTAVEDFAEQSRFCYRIAERFVAADAASDPQASGAGGVTVEENPFAQTSQLLLQHCFVLEWLYFETFLRNTLFAMLARHPHKIVASAGEEQLSIAAIFRASHSFASVDHLRDNLVARQIHQVQGCGHAVRELIDTLVGTFHFQSSPYDAQYLYQGQHTTSSLHDLTDLYALYLSIVPDSCGLQSRDERDRPAGRAPATAPPISEDSYFKAKAILHAVAGSIAQSIDNHWYDPT